MGEQYQIIQIDDSTWSIEDGFVRFFLLKGDEKALQKYLKLKYCRQEQMDY